MPRTQTLKLITAVKTQCKSSFKFMEQPKLLFIRLLNSTPLPPISEFNPLLASMTKFKEFVTVIKLYRLLETRFGVSPDTHSYSILIDCCCRVDCPDVGFSFLGKMMKEGYEFDGVTLKVVLSGVVRVIRRVDEGVCENVCKESLVGEAVRVGKEIVGYGYMPNVVGFGSLVKKLCRLGRWSEGRVLLDGVMGIGVVDRVSGLVDWFCKEGMIREAEYVVKAMRDRGKGLGVVGYGKVMEGYCLSGKVAEALRVLHQMERGGCKPDIVCYNILINGYCKSGKVKRALELFEDIRRKGFAPNTITYSTLLDGLFRANSPRLAKGLLKDMLDHGQDPDVVTLGSLLRGLCYGGQFRQAFALQRAVEKKGLPPNIVIYNILIDGLCNRGLVKEAGELFSRLSCKNIQPTGHTYTIMINGLCKHGKDEEAFDWLVKMVESGCLSNCAPYGVLLHYVSDKLDQHFPLSRTFVAKLYGLLDSDGISDSLKDLLENCLRRLEKLRLQTS
ncbi:hypothetical protein Drorol1_Dr00014566 [Drosera rotundifolia]